MIKRIFVFLSIIIFCLSTFAQSWKSYPHHQQGSVLTFPDDEGYHPGEIVEWWYTNAQITGDSTGNDYSFMFTYFYYPAFSYDGFRIFNLANETTGEFYPETMPCTYPTIEQDHMHLESNTGFTGGNQESWTTMKDSTGNLLPFQYHLNATQTNGSVDVYFNALKRPLMVGGTGYLYEGETGYTYYYSLSKLEIHGTITFKGVTETFSGTAWIDRQWGQFDPSMGEKYEWFSLQLSNGMDLNLWNLYNEQNEVPDTSTYRFCSIYINDSTDRTVTDLNLERLAYAWTTDTVRCYSQKWRLTYDNVDLTITTNHPHSEVSLPFRFYEGSTTIEGTVNGNPVTGIGFAELLHSYSPPEIEITSPISGTTWDGSQPITWQLMNPESGKNVYYDVEISTHNKTTFNKLARGITPTSYNWSPGNLAVGTNCWLRIIGYSVDSTLVGSKTSGQPFTIGVTGITEAASSVIDFFAAPNPFHQQTTINYQLKQSGTLQVDVLNIQGRLVKSLYDGQQTPGKHTIIWFANDALPGVYICRFQTAGTVTSRRIILLK